LHEKGCQKLTYGIQSFDDRLVALAGRQHTSQQAKTVVRKAFELGFERVDGDLIYGLLDQGVEGFCSDVQQMLESQFSTVVITKLHLRSFSETKTAIAGVSAQWQSQKARERISSNGHYWPSLGQEYQMREAAVEILERNGLFEYPTMYFQRPETGCGRWKSLVLDQDKQFVELGIGLGGSSASSGSSANITVNPREYFDAISQGTLPLEAMEMNREEQIASSIRRALSNCQPLRDDLHRQRFPESSLFDVRWKPIFCSLEDRGLASMDPRERTVALTGVGRSLVEAIINTEIR
jgi:oxygen-independent coproporphyrinogen-3 oxidase